jgi:hypothetical protein
MRAKKNKIENGDNVTWSYDDLRKCDLHLYRSLCKEILDNFDVK